LDLVRFLDIEKGWGPERDCGIRDTSLILGKFIKVNWIRVERGVR